MKSQVHRSEEQNDILLFPNRSNYCGKLDRNYLGETVSLCGWIDRHRSHGGVVFINLRDHTGIVQVNKGRECFFLLKKQINTQTILHGY